MKIMVKYREAELANDIFRDIDKRKCLIVKLPEQVRWDIDNIKKLMVMVRIWHFINSFRIIAIMGSLILKQVREINDLISEMKASILRQPH